MARTILAGDVGGTKIHLGLYGADGNALTRVADTIYPTHECSSLEEAMGRFLHGRAEVVAAACFGVPGPVINHVANPVNIPWSMRESSLSQALNNTPVRLLNDLQATAWGTFHLTASEIEVLQIGNPDAGDGDIVVIAAGTGLGEAGLIKTDTGWHAVASEGGHADFGPRDEEQIDLYRFLQKEFDHVSYERIVSGPGLHNVYRFLLSRGGDAEPGWIRERMRIEDPSAVIGEAALAGSDARCVRALEILASIYGAEAANLALKYLAVGGVYVCGGIAPKILPALKTGGFIRSFLDKGRFRSTLEQIPVRVCLNPDAALIGAAHVAATLQ